jgi:hypothetical protein
MRGLLPRLRASQSASEGCERGEIILAVEPDWLPAVGHWVCWGNAANQPLRVIGAINFGQVLVSQEFLLLFGGLSVVLQRGQQRQRLGVN